MWLYMCYRREFQIREIMNGDFWKNFYLKWKMIDFEKVIVQNECKEICRMFEVYVL